MKSDIQKTIKLLESLQHIATYVDEVLDTCGLEFLHASGSTSYDEHGATIHSLEGGHGILGILVVARAEHHDVGLGSHSSLDTLLYGSESEVVNHLIACTSEEVA
jgi:hypothetical protein